MLLTEIIKYSKKESKFIEFWNSCEWIYWEEQPQSIFLVKKYYCRQEYWFEAKGCALEIDWRSKKIKLNTYSSQVDWLLRFDLGGISEYDNELAEIVLNVFDDLMYEASLVPEKNDFIEKASFRKTKNKRIENRKFDFYPLMANNRISKFESLINKDKKQLTRKEIKKYIGI